MYQLSSGLQVNGTFFGFLILAITSILYPRTRKYSTALKLTGAATILADTFLQAGTLGSSTLATISALTVYSLLYVSTLTIASLENGHRRIPNIPIFGLAIAAWLLSALQHYDGTVDSILANPALLGVVAATGYMAISETRVTPLLASASTLAAVVVDFTVVPSPSLLGSDEAMVAAIVGLPALAYDLTLHGFPYPLRRDEAYIVPVAIVAPATTLFLVAFDPSLLARTGPYLWAVLPASVAIGGIVLATIEKGPRGLYPLAGAFILAFAGYSMGGYLNLSYPGLLGLSVFFVSALLAYDARTLAVSFLVLAGVSMAATHMSPMVCEDTIILPVGLDSPVEMVSAKGSGFTLYTGVPGSDSGVAFLPLRVDSTICGSTLSFQPILSFYKDSYSSSMNVLRVLSPPDIADVRVSPSEGLWSHFVSYLVLGETPSLGDRVYAVKVDILVYKGAFYHVLALVASVPTALLAYVAMEGGILERLLHKARGMLVRVGVKRLATLALSVVWLLSLIAMPASSYTTGISFSVEAGDSSLYITSFYGDTVIAMSTMRILLLQDTPYDIEFSIDYLSENTTLLAHVYYTCNGDEGVETVTLGSGDAARLSQTLPCPDFSNVTITAFNMIVIHDPPGQEQPLAAEMDVAGYLLSNGLKNYFIKNLKTYWFTLETRSVGEGWVNIYVSGYREKLGKIEVTSHGPFNSSQTLKILLEPYSLEFWVSANATITLVPAGQALNLTLDVEPGELVLVDAETPGIMPGLPYTVYLSISSPTHEETLNLSEETGLIVFVAVHANLEEIAPVNVDVNVEGCWARIDVTLPLKASPPEVSILYVPGDNVVPLLVFGGISSSGVNKSVLTVFLSSPRPLQGMLNITIWKTDIHMYRLSVPIAVETQCEATLSARTLQAGYLLVEKSPESVHVFPETAKADYLLVVTSNESIGSDEMVEVVVYLNVEPGDPIDPVGVYPIIQVAGEGFAGPAPVISYLINATNGGKTLWNEPPGKIVLRIPGSYITGAPPTVEAEAHFTLLLVFQNTANITVENITLAKFILNEEPAGDDGVWPVNVAGGEVAIAVLLVVILGYLIKRRLA